MVRRCCKVGVSTLHDMQSAQGGGRTLWNGMYRSKLWFM